jgi:hypothetical protein
MNGYNLNILAMLVVDERVQPIPEGRRKNLLQLIRIGRYTGLAPVLKVLYHCGIASSLLLG